MKTIFLVIFLAIDICATFTNFTTLVYIATTFNIKTHVFTLIFLDSISSTVCSVVSTLFDSLLLAGKLQPNHHVCFLAFLIVNLSNCFGSIFTALIAIVRYFLAKLSAKNIQPSNKKVSTIALAVFAALASINLSAYLTHAVLDLPVAFSIEVCANRDLSARPIKPISTLLLLIPIIFSLISLAIDMKMIRFLRKVIIPVKANVLSGLGTYCIFNLNVYFCLFVQSFMWLYF